MSEYWINIAIRTAATAIAVVAVILSTFKTNSGKKIRESAARIAEVVESLYRNSPSSEKLAAFKQLCIEQKVNVKKAVDFLERYIIPLSKKINIKPTSNKSDEHGDDNQKGWA